MGGPEVSFEGEEFLQKHPYIDYVISGEGEASFFEFLREKSAANPDYSRVQNLSYRENGAIYINEIGPLVKLESIPFPYDCLPIEQDKVCYYESTRGCPYRCSYCLSSIDKTIRILPLERVYTDLRHFLYNNVKQVKFVDRTFNFDDRRARDIFVYLMDHDNGYTNFQCEICAELLSDQTLKVLERARPGLFQFEIGVQTTNEITLNAINRSTNLEKLKERVIRLNELGNIHLHLDLIAGLPEEDFVSFTKSFNEVYALGGECLQLGFLKLFKGTNVREEASEYGYEYCSKPTYEVIINNHISAEGLMALKMVVNVLDLF